MTREAREIYSDTFYDCFTPSDALQEMSRGVRDRSGGHRRDRRVGTTPPVPTAVSTPAGASLLRKDVNGSAWCIRNNRALGAVDERKR